jgi:hypothetical protein
MISYNDAFRAKRANELSTWSSPTRDALATPFAAARIHSNTENGLAEVQSTSSFKVDKDARFFCIGSCFAREIEDAISDVGLSATTKTRFHELIDANPYLFQRREGIMGRPHAFLNRYNLGSMGDLMEIVAQKQPENEALLYPAGQDHFHDYHYSRMFEARSFEDCLERRKRITDTYHQAARDADIFVFTFGLCESFYDRRGDRYLNVTPDPRTARGQELEFRFLSFDENIRQGQRIIEAVRHLNPKARIILTVSPVPLDVTFSEHDIIVANSLAKATLLLTAHTLAQKNEGCLYFPSYEIVMNSAQEKAWLWDRKHVSPPMVNHIMQSFIARHVS